MKKIAIAFVFLFSLFRLSIYAQDCKQILSAGIYDISSAITTTERAALFRFTFPETQNAFVIIDAIDKNSYIQIVLTMN